MKYKAHPLFWKAYGSLNDKIKQQAKKSFELWRENPFHPSLHFKCVNKEENVWSLRISHVYRALCIFEKDTVIWFWIGNHDEYMRMIKSKKI
ncbi:MAG: hypothetical protein Q9M37_06595 [Desulfonauticus sp.]|nr:hypothetical protein [Desulfonauticus sp.]